MTQLNVQPADLRLPASLGLSDTAEQEVRDSLWLAICLGDVMVEDAVDQITDEHPDVDPEQAAEAFRHLVRARRAQQAEIGPVENKLTAAFEELEGLGVLARENFTCCETCLQAEIGDELTDDQPWYGYVAYHQQDAERLVADGETYLSYGLFPAEQLSREEWDAMPEDQRDAWYDGELVKLLTEKVVPTLERHGITVEWDGTVQQRMLLKGVELYTELDPVPAKVVDEETGVATYCFGLNGTEAESTLEIQVPLELPDDEELERGEAGACVVWGASTVAYNAIEDLELLGPDSIGVSFTEDAADELGLPKDLLLSCPGEDLTALFEDLHARLVETGDLPVRIGEGGNLVEGRHPLVHTLAITLEHDSIGFARLQRPNADEIAEYQHLVAVSHDEQTLMGAITGWELVGEDTVRLTVDAEAAPELGLQVTTDWTFEPASDARLAYERVLDMLRGSGEADESGAILDEPVPYSGPTREVIASDEE